jgi:hypothetical protein
MLTKICSCCGEEKAVDLFRKINSSGKLNTKCIQCFDAKCKAYRDANADLCKQKSAIYRERNKDRILTSARRYRKDNKDFVKEYNKIYRESDRARHNSSRKARQVHKLNRTPSWTTSSDLLQIKVMYECSARVSKCLGILHHVDHIIPLQGKRVSGLHVPNNLQVIPATLNLQKGNRYGNTASCSR